MNKTLKEFLGSIDRNKILTFEKFNNLSLQKIQESENVNLTENEAMLLSYTKINIQRTSRILKTFKPTGTLEKIISQINSPQTWFAITEDWCGDSAQNLPYFSKYAELNPNIDFNIILRDKNLDLVDNYFTEGNPRSIPKVVGFNSKGEEIFVWGARPKVAQELVTQLKNDGFSKEEFNKKLHLWYAKNKGKELEKELISLLSK